MIRMFYTPGMIAKARRWAAEIYADVPSGGSRGRRMEELGGKRHGLTYDYLTRIGERSLHPSARSVRNLGYEIWVRDLETGVMEKAELDLQYDWNPHNPKRLFSPATSPSSSSLSRNEPEDESDGSE